MPLKVKEWDNSEEEKSRKRNKKWIWDLEYLIKRRLKDVERVALSILHLLLKQKELV